VVVLNNVVYLPGVIQKRLSELVQDKAFMAKVDEELHAWAAPFVQSYYPNMDYDTIERNILDLIWCKNAEAACRRCFGLEMCDTLLRTQGYAFGHELLPSGLLRVYVHPCQYGSRG
jgi:hypothetical protein